VRAKVSRGGEALTISPEYDDCKRVARECRVALRTVLEEARVAARRLVS
jgi:uncharacterized protein (DUF111 family)